MLDASTAIDLCRSALVVAVVLAAPMLLVGMAAGLGIGLIQALTQIQDQTVSFVPKILAMVAVMIACQRAIPRQSNQLVRIKRIAGLRPVESHKSAPGEKIERILGASFDQCIATRRAETSHIVGQNTAGFVTIRPVAKTMAGCGSIQRIQIQRLAPIRAKWQISSAPGRTG